MEPRIQPRSGGGFQTNVGKRGRPGRGVVEASEMTSRARITIATPPEIARVLDCICNSAGFRRSPRLQRFLRYVVEHVVAEPGKSLKELQIAMDVFDRDESFEPKVDPIVRVEAG